MQLHGNKRLLIGVLLTMWLVTSACSCSGLLEGASRLRRTRMSPTPTPSSSSEERSAPLPSPTATSPRVEAAPSPTDTTSVAPSLPEGSGQSFDIRLTEQELDDYLEDQVFEQQGVGVSDIDVRVDAERITATFQVAHAESGMNGGVTVSGVPKVADGELYVEIEDFALDESVSGFKRIVANSLIKAALEEYSTSHGIPVPVDNLTFETVQLMPGAIRVTGRTR